jgi:hypothetical protein
MTQKVWNDQESLERPGKSGMFFDLSVIRSCHPFPGKGSIKDIKLMIGLMMLMATP